MEEKRLEFGQNCKLDSNAASPAIARRGLWLGKRWGVGVGKAKTPERLVAIVVVNRRGEAMVAACRVSRVLILGLSMDGFKQQHICVLQKADGEDRISSLPDCLLHHILSFLPTKEAVATGILSRRWKYLWSAVPNVDFDDYLLYSSRVHFWYPIQVTCFMNFVERVLLLRDALDIKKFRLSCRVCFSATRVHAWISAAVRHNVQDLDLCLFVEEPFVLPHSVFGCASLTILKLEMNNILQLPNNISLPALKILHLCLVTFPNNTSTQRLFSCCPMLEELAILDCEWIDLKSIAISIPSLRRLVIDDLPVFGSIDDSNGCDIKIDGENLEFFKYSGYLTNEIHLSKLSSSVKADLHIPMLYQLQEKVACHSVKLFHGLKNITSLKITNSTIESLFLADNVIGCLPLFRCLMHLEVGMQVEDHVFGALIKFLTHLPKLESLKFSMGFDSRSGLVDGCMLNSEPSCFLSSLKTLDVQNFRGSNNEMFLLKILLKNALCLERVNISFCTSPLGNLEKHKDLRNQLEKLPRGSKHPVIVFF